MKILRKFNFAKSFSYARQLRPVQAGGSLRGRDQLIHTASPRAARAVQGLGEPVQTKMKIRGEGKCLSRPGTSQVVRTHEVIKSVLNNARKICIMSV